MENKRFMKTNLHVFIKYSEYYGEYPDPCSASTVPKTGTVEAKRPLNAAIVPDFGTVRALTGTFLFYFPMQNVKCIDNQ